MNRHFINIHAASTKKKHFKWIKKLTIGIVEVHAFLICNVFFCDMNIGKISLKE